MPITADLTKNPKQELFFNTVIEAAFGDNPFRYLFYGGAIRGGKTFACLITLIILCKIFPGSKWYVLRKDFSRIQETTLPAMYKLLGRSPNVRWNRDKANYYVEFLKTGSRIYFAGENFAQDQTLNWMLGLEANGFFLEQIEELQEITLDMCISRAGSWYIETMPTPIIMGTFNPTQTWVRRRIYKAHEDGTLVAPYFYMAAMPQDNPFVTAEQWKAWGYMDPELQKQFIKGDWNFAKPSNVFAYAFDEERHHADLVYDPDDWIYLSFDFNVEPIVCLAGQHDINYVHLFREYRLLNSDIWELTDRIVADFPSAYFQVTGDASGQARTALKKNWNYYKIIKHQLNIAPNQLMVPRSNPAVRNTRVLCNALLSRHEDYHLNTVACPFLTDDLNGVVVDENGDIDKDKDKRKTHLLDAFRYYNWTWHRDFLDKSIYQYAGNV